MSDSSPGFRRVGQGLMSVGKGLLDVSDYFYQADAVSQYNTGRSRIIEAAFRDYASRLSTRGALGVDGQEANPGIDPDNPTYQLGQVKDEALVKLDHNALVKRVRKQVIENTPNRTAQERLLAELDMKEVVSYSQVKDYWQKLRTADMLQESKTLLKGIVEGPGDVATKIAKIGSELTSNVATALRTAADAAVMRETIVEQVQMVWAKATAMQFASLIDENYKKPDPAVEIQGLVKPGNIDLAKRPIAFHPNGTFSTVNAKPFTIDGQEVLLATISDAGRVVSDQEALDAFKESGNHLGIFTDKPAAIAYANQLHRDQAAEYTTLAKVERWIDENTHFWDMTPENRIALKQSVRNEVEFNRSEKQRLNDLYDREADGKLESLEYDVRDNLDGLISLQGRLKEFGFKNSGKLDSWSHHLESRISELQQKAARRPSSGPDPDDLEDKRITAEYQEIYGAIARGEKLSFSPRFSPGNAPSLVVGGTPTYSDLARYALYNRGAYTGEDGLAHPRLKVAFADGAYKSLLSDRPPEFTAAVSRIWDSSKVTKDQPKPPLTQAQASDLVARLDAGFAAGDIKREDIGKTAAAWATRISIQRASDDALPATQGLLTGKWKTDTTEQFINDASNDVYYNWTEKTPAERNKIALGIDSMKQKIFQRVAERVGKPPTGAFVQNGEWEGSKHGEIYVWYQDPSRPGDTLHGEVYRYRPEKVENGKWAGTVPVLQKWGPTGWDDVKELRPAVQAQEEVLAKRKRIADLQVSVTAKRELLKTIEAHRADTTVAVQQYTDADILNATNAIKDEEENIAALRKTIPEGTSSTSKATNDLGKAVLADFKALPNYTPTEQELKDVQELEAILENYGKAPLDAEKSLKRILLAKWPGTLSRLGVRLE